MLKQYELLDILEGLISEFENDEWETFLQVESKRILNDKLIVNFVELSEKYGFSDNKYLIEIRPVYKNDEYDDEIHTWNE